jgi:alkanesulfonate monooxygenase SsuD/methylene tetrahydromethanopterin reductase-like flavin-dependent oxidoreductase (luciferase family)
LPIIFGGESEAALRWVADAGQGWFGFGREPETAAANIGHLGELLEARGRTRADIEVTVAPKPGLAQTRGLVEAFAESGADQVIFVIGARDAEDCIRRMDVLAREVIA